MFQGKMEREKLEELFRELCYKEDKNGIVVERKN